MGNLKQKFTDMFAWMQDGIHAVTSVYSEKGPGIFKIPALMLVLGPLAIWMFLYKPAYNSYTRKSRFISSIQAQKEYGSDFLKLKKDLSQKENILVRGTDKSSWLSSFIRGKCADENVIIRSMTDQQESELGKHYIKATINFSFSSSFDKAVKVIVSLENSPYLIRVSQVDFTKSPTGSDLGRVSVSITADTIIPKETLAGS